MKKKYMWCVCLRSRTFHMMIYDLCTIDTKEKSRLLDIISTFRDYNGLWCCCYSKYVVLNYLSSLLSNSNVSYPYYPRTIVYIPGKIPDTFSISMMNIIIIGGDGGLVPRLINACWIELIRLLFVEMLSSVIKSLEWQLCSNLIWRQ